MINKIKISHIKILFSIIVTTKILALFFLKIYQPDFLPVGGDADFYDQFAIGESDFVTSIWPVLLRALDEAGLYNRVAMTGLLFFISTLITPFVFASLLPRIIGTSHPGKYKQAYWGIATIIAFYPTLFIFSLDIYRDAVMVILVGVCMCAIKKYIDSSLLKRIMLFVMIAMLIYLVYLFRPYLGFSLLAAFFLYRINILKIKKSFVIIGYLVLLMIACRTGALDALLEYRGSEGFEMGGSSLGIGLIGKNPVEFILLYLYSALFQFFGLYITSINAFIFFVVESVFIIFCITYIVKNSEYLTSFLRYLLIFSIIYGTIWTLGNDNLGTAIRLRMYDYLAITIIAASLYLNKNVKQENTKVHS
jgi:hypothetical protein